MLSIAIRFAAALILLLGVSFIGYGASELHIAAGDELFGPFRRAGGCLLCLSGVAAAVAGARCLVQPGTGTVYPFLATPRFWRWLLAGLLTIFFSLGFSMPGLEEARFLCRALCACWLTLLLTPLLWPHRLLDWGKQLLATRLTRGLDLVVGNLVVLVILSELVLRLFAAWAVEDALLLNKTTGYRMKPGTYPNGLRINSLGFADDEFVVEKTPGVFRIAALGDSFSVGAWVSHEENYLTLLERHLPGVEVYNFGVCGTGPREYRNLLASLVWSYQPDLVLVPIFVGNDITEWIASPRLTRFNPDALHTELLARRLSRLAHERWRKTVEDTGDYQMQIQAPMSERTYVEVVAGRLNVCRVQETPIDRQHWQQVEHHLEAVFADCRAHGVPVAVLLLPDEFQVHPDLLSRALVHRGWQKEDIDLSAPQRRLQRFCASRQVLCLDLIDCFQASGEAAHFRNDGHWNPLGNRIAAEAVGHWIIHRPPEPRP